MPHREQNSVFEDVMELLTTEGFAGMADALSLLLNEAMRLERQDYLKAAPYERTEKRLSYANGFKPKMLNSRVGKLELAIPQTRDSAFYPSSLEKGLRSERALKLALAEMYVQGVSTRKVAKITEELCGLEISSSQVSRATKSLDDMLAGWRQRRLDKPYAYVYLDARYEKIREGGQVINAAVLVALGVDAEGYREVLGCSVELSEQEIHWRKFISDLKNRGLHGMKLFISDAHEGLKAARTAVFPSVPWQRCQFHLQQNAQKYIPNLGQNLNLRKTVAREIRSIFNAPNLAEAQRLLSQFTERYAKTAPRLSQWAEEALPEGFTVFQMPEAHRRKIRTSNVLERVNKEIKRRTRVATLFPNAKSCERLVCAVIMEISEEWLTGKKYLTMDET
jgi:putative transposase